MDEPKGRGDAISILYVLGGIPAMVGFFVLFFTVVERCGLPG
jgi:hypothetical protein